VKGPVWIDVPLDLQSAAIEPADLERFTPARDCLSVSDADLA
jgi:hypothetical protein